MSQIAYEDFGYAESAVGFRCENCKYYHEDMEDVPHRYTGGCSLFERYVHKQLGCCDQFTAPGSETEWKNKSGAQLHKEVVNLHSSQIHCVIQ